MVSATVLCSFVSLLQAASTRSLPRQEDKDNGILVPKLLSDFQKGNSSAQWAEGHPKKWGSEEVSIQFNVPDPNDVFASAVTENEKYLLMFNGSHIRITDLDSAKTVDTFPVAIPQGYFLSGLTLRFNSQGTYDLLIAGTNRRYATPTDIFHTRLGLDLKLIDGPKLYEAGEIGDFDKNGKMATTRGYIYDLNKPETAPITLKNAHDITGMSFSGDGQYISTVGWTQKLADLWNATTGEKILEFPPTKAQNWLTKISPDNKYVVISLGTGYLQIYSLADLSAAPKVLGPFNNWIRAIEWSPDGKHLATGDTGRMQLWKFPEAERVQSWEVDGSEGGAIYELYGLSWLDGGNKISWMFRNGRHMYDFEKNVKYWWTLGLKDHSWGGAGITFLKDRGFVATSDGDSTVRFWKL